MWLVAMGFYTIPRQRSLLPLVRRLRLLLRFIHCSKEVMRLLSPSRPGIIMAGPFAWRGVSLLAFHCHHRTCSILTLTIWKSTSRHELGSSSSTPHTIQRGQFGGGRDSWASHG